LIEPYAYYKRLNGQLDGVVWAATSYPVLSSVVEKKSLHSLKTVQHN
jgi:phosphoribosylcarboxyaminoimidazole (NCAIR) mutase